MPSKALIKQPKPDELIRHALGESKLTVEFPGTATLEDVDAALGVAIIGFQRISDAGEKLKPVIGRMLQTVRDRELWRGPYASWTAYVREKVAGEMGFSQSNAWEALKIADAFPTLTIKDYETYGARKLALASRITSEDDRNYRRILEKSRQVTVDEWRRHVSSIQRQTGSPEEATAVIAVRCTPAVEERWQTLVKKHPHVTAGKIFEKLLDFGDKLKF